MTLFEYSQKEGRQVKGLGRDASDGRKLGAVFEGFIAQQLDTHNARRIIQGLPPIKANWTQPRFVGGRGNWRPAGKGWVDLNLFLPGGASIEVDLKAADMGAAKNKNRWVLDPKLRRDHHKGHQIATLDGLAALGHRVGVLLGRWWPQHQQWKLYLVPVMLDFNRPSIPWEELEDFRVRNGQQWWEVPQ